MTDSKKIRFIITGGVATILDFGLLFAFKFIGLPAVFANFPATFLAMIFSYNVNKKFTFKDSPESRKKQILLFFTFTIFGLWVLQPIIFLILKDIMEELFNNQDLGIFAVKVIATGVTMIWNFITYDKLVFNNQGEKS